MKQVKKDLHDGDPWSDMAVRDLRDALGRGDTIETAAELLCRSGTVDDVRRKAKGWGWHTLASRAPANPRAEFTEI